MNKILLLLLLSILFLSCSKDDEEVFNLSEYKTYKVLVTYMNCDVIEQNGKSTIIMSKDSRVTGIELLEPDYVKLTKKDCVKLYNTDFVEDDAVPSQLQEGPNTIGFAISTTNEEGESFVFSININVMYSSSANPTKTFKRVYTIQRKMQKETIENDSDLGSFMDDLESIPEGFTRYKILITYDNSDLIKKDGKERLLISDESVVKNIEMIEPEYSTVENVLKFYNGNVNTRDNIPSNLDEGSNRINFVVTIFNPVSNRSNTLSVNVDAEYSKSASPKQTVKRLYIIDRKTEKETIK